MVVKNTRSEEIIAEKIARISSLEEDFGKSREEYVRNLFKVITRNYPYDILKGFFFKEPIKSSQA